MLKNKTLHLTPLFVTYQSTRWFKYDRDCNRLVYTQIVPVIFELPCNLIIQICL